MDEESFHIFYEQTHRNVRAYLRSVLTGQNVVDDLLQEVFCRAWQARDRYSEQGKPRAYLMRIAGER